MNKKMFNLLLIFLTIIFLLIIVDKIQYEINDTKEKIMESIND
jgi:hypothetical protein